VARLTALKRALVRAAIFLAGLGAAVVAVELWLEHFLPIGALVQELDPVLLARPIPGARSVLQMDAIHGGERIPLRIDEQGFRGPPVSAEKTGLRVVVYGDSMVMAENVREEESFVVRLGEELSEALGRPVETVNAGVSGYGPDQACLRMEQEVDALHADLVVFVLCATNDLGDLVRNKLFGLDESGKLVRNEVEFDPKLLADFESRRKEAARPAIVRAWSAIRHSLASTTKDPTSGHALNPFVPLYLQSARDEWAETVREHGHRVRNLFRDVYDADVAIEPESESARYKVALMGAVLARWHEECALRSLPLLAVCVPSAVDLDPHFQVRVDPLLYPAYDPRRLSETFARLLAAASIPAVDLYDLFAAPREAELFEGFLDIHWNVTGQALAAEQVSAEIVARGLL
jgi:lysophospholipase L1-like esterase